MTLAEVMLAAMLALAPKGGSVYSVVPALPNEPAPCAEVRITCRAAWQDAGHFARAGAWVRYEQPAEQAERLRVIAEAIAEHPDLAPWLLTVSYHESGAWRRDVHAGVGKWSRGDGGDSWGLYQFLLGGSRRSKAFDTGLVAGDIVGTDALSTKAATDLAADLLGPAVRACRGEASCVFGKYGGVAHPMRHPGIRARVATMKKVRELLRLTTTAAISAPDERTEETP